MGKSTKSPGPVDVLVNINRQNQENNEIFILKPSNLKFGMHEVKQFYLMGPSNYWYMYTYYTYFFLFFRWVVFYLGQS